MFPIVPILIFTTIINPLIPSGPILEPLTPTRPHLISPINATRIIPVTWGRTFVDYADGFFSAGVSLNLPPLWTSKPPARRSVCISHGMRLSATPAQCMTLVSSQLRMPLPTGLSLPAPRTFLALPASRRVILLTLPPAPVRAPVLLLPAPKRIPILALPSPERLLTLSSSPQPPALVLFLPVLDDLYTFPFPTLVAHVLLPTWEAPADLLWSARGARNIFAAKHVVNTCRIVTILVMECLVGLSLVYLLLTCFKGDVLDLTEVFIWLAQCAANFELECDILEAYFVPADAEDATDGLDADMFTSLDSMARDGPTPVSMLSNCANASVDVAGGGLGASKESLVGTTKQDTRGGSSISEAAHPSTTTNVVGESAELEISGPLEELEESASEDVEQTLAPKDTCVESESVEENYVDTVTAPSNELASETPAETPTPIDAAAGQDDINEQPEETMVQIDDVSSGPATGPQEASTSDKLEEFLNSLESGSELTQDQPEQTRVEREEHGQALECKVDNPTTQPEQSVNEDSGPEHKTTQGSSCGDESVESKDNSLDFDIASKVESTTSKTEDTVKTEDMLPEPEPAPVELPASKPRTEDAATGLSASRWAPGSGSRVDSSRSGSNGGGSFRSGGNDGGKKGGGRQRGKKWQGNENGGVVDGEKSGCDGSEIGESSGAARSEGANEGSEGDGEGPRGNSRPQWFIKTRRKARR